MALRRQLWSRSRSKLRRFETLEKRQLLTATTYLVTTTLDVVNLSDGKLSLREAISAANANPGADTILLQAGSTYKITIAGAGEDNNATGDFDVLDSLTIKATGIGANPIVSGNGLDRVFNIPAGHDSASLTFDHITITGGIAKGNGGGVAGESGNNALTFLTSTVKNNIATSPTVLGFGGGIYNFSGDINLSSSHVDSNFAAGGNGSGGGIYLDSGPGAITINNSTINSNSASIIAGGLYSDSAGALTVTDSQINYNHSGDGGAGGVYLVTLAPVFTGSSISSNTTGGIAGAIFCSMQSEGIATVTKCTISSNSAADDAGAIYGDLTAEMNITGSTFANNTAAGGGGAMSRITSVEATDTVFNHNVAHGNGGAIDQNDSSGGITLLRTTFSRNVSLTGSGGAIYCTNAQRDLDITDSKFTSNTARDSGGAIIANEYRLTILRSTFDHNTSTSGSGGAIDGGVDPSDINATDSTFTYNKAKTGGGAFDSQGGNITLVRCKISNNAATSGNGGGFTDGQGTFSGSDIVMITDCTIANNSASGNGGGFSEGGNSLTMTGSTVSGNHSGSEGGGMWVATTGGTSSVTNCTISGNIAVVDGGGVSLPFGIHVITFINDTIAFNISAMGGGIFNGAPSTTNVVHVGNTIIANNLAFTGPDVFGDAFMDLGHNLIYSLLGSNNLTDPSDIIGQDPLLGPLANNGGLTQTHALLFGSPAINAADNTLAPSTDQRGVKRPQPPGGIADIGAFEKILV